ncbi:MAG: diguanylate cyclase [Methylocystis sp.]|nr:MAG: diguanylate cyclase [Methylocystis sp.]
MPQDPTALILAYFVTPLWLAMGLLDWFCHRATQIETTTGAKESLIHLLMFLELGAPLLAVLFFVVNALVIAFMIAMFALHEATAIWDVSYAETARRVTPFEQHVHSFLEVLPLTALLLVVARHWGQFLALFGAGDEAPRFDLVWKGEDISTVYVAAVIAGAAVFGLIPYLEELWRGLRASGGALTPAREAQARDVRA